MKKSLLTIISFALSYAVHSQLYSWTPVTGSITGNLNDVATIDASTAIVVGSSIWKTTDGGASWIEQTNPQGTELKSILMYDNNNGYASGVNGTLLRTTNGGTTWNQISTGYTCTFSGLSGLGNPGIYTVCESSGDIPYSTDGTSFNVLATWSPFAINDLEFVSATTGWIIGEDDIFYKTTDGGTGWNTQSSPVINKFLNNIKMIDENTGYIVGDGGTIIKTTNGGSTWTSQTSGTTQDLLDVSFINVNDGWAVGNNGTLLKTIDGGTTWTAQTGVTTTSMKGVSVLSASAGYSVGTNGTILKLQDVAELTTLPESSQFHLYPNPTNGLITFNTSVDYTIYSISGKELMSGKAQTVADLTKLPAAVYLIEMRSGDWVGRTRIVKE